MTTNNSSTISINLSDEEWKSLNESSLNDTGSEYAVDTSYTYSPGATVGGTYTISSDYTGTTNFDNSISFPTSITFDNSTSSFAPVYGNEIEDNWPAEYKIEKMIEIYPALKLRYQKFIEIYNLCKDDYKSRTDDDIPF